MVHQVREVVAVFDHVETLEKTVMDLGKKGIDAAALSLLASEQAVEEKFGQRYRRVEEMEDCANAPRQTFFNWASRLDPGFGLTPALAFIGMIAVMLGSETILLPILIGAGGGALLGAVLRKAIHHHYVERLDRHLQRGGLLLWVNVRNQTEERTATAVLKSNGARDVHAHKLAM